MSVQLGGPPWPFFNWLKNRAKTRARAMLTFLKHLKHHSYVIQSLHVMDLEFFFVTRYLDSTKKLIQTVNLWRSQKRRQGCGEGQKVKEKLDVEAKIAWISFCATLRDGYKPSKFRGPIEQLESRKCIIECSRCILRKHRIKIHATHEVLAYSIHFSSFQDNLCTAAAILRGLITIYQLLIVTKKVT